jgi:hypothetical protein
MKRTPSELFAPSEESEIGEHHFYLNPDGSINNDRLARLVRNTPGALDVLVVRGLINGGTIHDRILQEVLVSLSWLLMRALYSLDSTVDEQLIAAAKVLYPEKYDLPASKIRELVEHYETSPPLARGWELRRLMSSIADIVEPARTGKSLSLEQPVNLISSPNPEQRSRWEWAKKHWKRGSTLQSLAIRMYLDHLDEIGVTGVGAAITSASLKRDLAEVRRWEETHDTEQKRRRGYTLGVKLGEVDRLAWCDHSAGWKTRRIARQQTVKGGSKRKR